MTKQTQEQGKALVELTREEFEERKKNASFLSRMDTAGIKYEDALEFRRRRKEIEEKYPDNTGRLNAFRGGIEAAQNLTAFARNSYSHQITVRVMGGLMLCTGLYGLFSFPVEREGLMQLAFNNPVKETLGAYILAEGAAMLASGRFVPLGLGMTNYAGKAVAYVRDIIKKRK